MGEHPINLGFPGRGSSPILVPLCLGRRPKSSGPIKREVPLRLSRLLDSSLRQALGGVTVSTAEST